LANAELNRKGCLPAPDAAIMPPFAAGSIVALPVPGVVARPSALPSLVLAPAAGCAVWVVVGMRVDLVVRVAVVLVLAVVLLVPVVVVVVPARVVLARVAVVVLSGATAKVADPPVPGLEEVDGLAASPDAADPGADAAAASAGAADVGAGAADADGAGDTAETVAGFDRKK